MIFFVSYFELVLRRKKRGVKSHIFFTVTLKHWSGYRLTWMMKPLVNYSFGSKWVVGYWNVTNFRFYSRILGLLIECFYNWSWWILKWNRIIKKGNEWKYFHTSRGMTFFSASSPSFSDLNCNKRLNPCSWQSIRVWFSHDIELKSRMETINGNERIVIFQFWLRVFKGFALSHCKMVEIVYVL